MCRRNNILFVMMLHFSSVRGFSLTSMPSLNRYRSSISFRSRFPTHRGCNSKSNNAEENVSNYIQSKVPSLEEYANESNRNDQVFSAISRDGSVKITVCTARNLINDLMLMHTMTAVPSDALGRTVVSALMMSNGLQAEQTCQITLNGDGPLRGVVAISNGKGEVRGYVGSPMLGDVELSVALGNGNVQVVKNHPDWPNPYNGITSIKHGNIDDDIGGYLAESEQRSCALAAAVSVNGFLCTAAGGYLIEQLPNASSETLAKVEQNLSTLVQMDGGDKLPTNLLLNGVTPLEIAQMVLKGLDIVPLQQISPRFQCQCTPQRLIRALRLLPRNEVEEILIEEESIKARCEFCGKTYEMGPDEIRKNLENNNMRDPSLDSDWEKEIESDDDDE